MKKYETKDKKNGSQKWDFKDLKTEAQVVKSTKKDKDSSGGSGKYVFWVIIIALALGAVGIFYTQDLTNFERKPTPTPTPMPTPTPTPTPTPSPELKPEDVSITILNGSGVAGVAGKTAELIEEEGYTIETVDNADKSNYEKTLIQYKPDMEKIALDIIRILGVGLPQEEKNQETDIVITIGRDYE